MNDWIEFYRYNSLFRTVMRSNVYPEIIIIYSKDYVRYYAFFATKMKILYETLKKVGLVKSIFKIRCKRLSPQWCHNVEIISWRFHYFYELMFWSKIWVFSDGVRQGNIKHRLAQIPFYLMLMCVVIWTKTNVKIVLKQTCALFSRMQNK